MKILMQQVTIIQSDSGDDTSKDVLLENGVIREIATSVDESQADLVIDCRNLWLMPGIFDMHVHLREPGFEHKEDIASGTKAAARGGVTGVLAMPNTKPTVETAEVVKDIQNRIQDKAIVDVQLTGSITKGLKGEALSDIKAMIDAGIVAITDDGRTTMSESFMIEAYQLIKPHQLVLISHSEDHDIAGEGVVHEGEVSRALGIKGLPPEVESNIVMRDIELCKKTQSKLHIAHISAQTSVDAVRKAIAEGVDVSAEACPHHFILTDEILRTAGTLAKVNPPIRSERHRKAVEEGILDGTITCIVTDHAPHTLEEKSRGFERAPFGISGVELSLPLTYTHFVKSGKISPQKLVELMAINPRKRLNLPIVKIEIGATADCILFDPKATRIIKADAMVSRGKNIPYEGMEVSGEVVMTIAKGQVVYKGGKHDYRSAH